MTIRINLNNGIKKIKKISKEQGFGLIAREMRAKQISRVIKKVLKNQNDADCTTNVELKNIASANKVVPIAQKNKGPRIIHMKPKNMSIIKPPFIFKKDGMV